MTRFMGNRIIRTILTLKKNTKIPFSQNRYQAQADVPQGASK